MYRALLDLLERVVADDIARVDGIGCLRFGRDDNTKVGLMDRIVFNGVKVRSPIGIPAVDGIDAKSDV
jgi:hypothetical protein